MHAGQRTPPINPGLKGLTAHGCEARPMAWPLIKFQDSLTNQQNWYKKNTACRLHQEQDGEAGENHYYVGDGVGDGIS